MFFDDGDFGRERYNEMIKEGDRQRIAAKAERHERMRHKLMAEQTRRTHQQRQPRVFTLFGLLAR